WPAGRRTRENPAAGRRASRFPTAPFMDGIRTLVSQTASGAAVRDRVMMGRASYSWSRAERVTHEQGFSMRTIRAMLVFSAFLAHATIAQASSMTPAGDTKIARATAEAAAAQPADASASG